jgi:hypothetical protein
MLNQTIVLKVKQRLNKLDSQDYDNIEQWEIVEAFNKAQVEWVRRQLHGLNVKQEGDEQSTRRKDDLQVLLKTEPLQVSQRDLYFDGDVPQDYLQWKRVDITAEQDCCSTKNVVVYLAEEGNVGELLRDDSKKPSFDWRETFATLKDNKVLIYTNNNFTIDEAALTYYKQPIRIEITGVFNPYTGVTPTTDVESEFKDDIIELIIDETVSILGGDIESPNQMGRGMQTAERNN